jgi:hypothetical protein
VLRLDVDGELELLLLLLVVLTLDVVLVVFEDELERVEVVERAEDVAEDVREVCVLLLEVERLEDDVVVAERVELLDLLVVRRLVVREEEEEVRVVVRGVVVVDERDGLRNVSNVQLTYPEKELRQTYPIEGIVTLVVGTADVEERLELVRVEVEVEFALVLVPVAEPGTHPSGTFKKVQVTTDEVVREVDEVLEVGGGVVVLRLPLESVLLSHQTRRDFLTVA